MLSPPVHKWPEWDSTKGYLTPDSELFPNPTGSGPHTPDSVKQDVNEEGIALSRDVAFGQEHLVVAALHQVLQRSGVEKMRG